MAAIKVFAALLALSAATTDKESSTDKRPHQVPQCPFLVSNQDDVGVGGFPDSKKKKKGRREKTALFAQTLAESTAAHAK